MSMKVFANGREIAGKASDGKSIACFPDVCISPPSPPAGPIPIPYPNTAMASDTTSGSKTVKLHGKEAMLKDKSYFKKSTGDEPATNNFGAGVITHKITGKVFFASFSMDVFIEGENVVRHLDLTTHNHGSVPGNTATWPYLALPSGAMSLACHDEAKKEYKACEDFAPHRPGGKDACEIAGANVAKKTGVNTARKARRLAAQVAGKGIAPASVDQKEYEKASACLQARRCQLAAIEPTGRQTGCCQGQTAHHLVLASSLHDRGRGGRKRDKESGKFLTSIPIEGIKDYRQGKAPCVCVEGTNQNHGTHGRMHTFTSYLAATTPGGKEELPLSKTVVSSILGKVDEIEPDAPIRQTQLQTVVKSGTDYKINTETLTYKQARDQSIAAMQTCFADAGCSTQCLQAQIDAYHNQCGINDETKIRKLIEGKATAEDVRKAGGDKLLDNYSNIFTNKKSLTSME